MSKTTFIDGNPSQGIPGTIVLAAFLNAINNHYHTGRAVDGEGALAHGDDVGAANAYVINLNPALPAYVAGMSFSFVPANMSTGSSMLNINGLGAKAVRKSHGDELGIGDIMPGQIAFLFYNGTYFELLNPLPEPVGSIRFLAGSAIPSGYIKANGALLNRSSYPRLWAYAAGSGNIVSEAAWQAGNSAAWSSGDGSTTFRLPDLRGEFLRIWDDSRGVDSGRSLSAPQADQNKEHNHGASAGNNNASHYHGVAGSTGNESATHAHNVAGDSGNESADHTHSGTTGSDSVEHTHEVPGQGWAGGAGSPVTDHFSQGTNNGGAFTLPTSGRSAAHQHPFATGGRSATHKHPVNLNSGTESANHQHPVSLNSGNESAVHQHAITVNNAGGAEARPRNAALAAFIKY